LLRSQNCPYIVSRLTAERPNNGRSELPKLIRRSGQRLLKHLQVWRTDDLARPQGDALPFKQPCALQALWADTAMRRHKALSAAEQRWSQNASSNPAYHLAGFSAAKRLNTSSAKFCANGRGHNTIHRAPNNPPRRHKSAGCHLTSSLRKFSSGCLWFI
jgi:hypothetical protein